MYLIDESCSMDQEKEIYFMSRFSFDSIENSLSPVAMASIAHCSLNVHRWRWHSSNFFPPALSTFRIPVGFLGQAIEPNDRRLDFAEPLPVRHSRPYSIHRFQHRPLPNGCSQGISRNFDASNDCSKRVFVNIKYASLKTKLCLK